jgi:N-methylhydantoinase B
VFGKTIAALATAGGVGSGAYFHYRGVDNNGHDFQFTDVVAEGMPGRPADDGIDAQGCAAGIAAAAVETVENDYPLVIEQYRALMDSGGAGRHRGGHGVEKIYLLLAAGEIALYGERQHTPAWGIAGGKAGSCSQTWLIRQDGSRETLPAKTDHVKVQSGDRIVLHSAGGGGWGDPLQRDAQRVAEDVARALLTAAAAQDVYGVVLNSGATITIDQRATRELRARRQREKEGKPLPRHDFGGRPG